ncbi:MAG TPA: hypothetical protein PLR06_12490 [Cyclobacteriaceae bacterium]|nr:hypothetical protein [Cyclobacteriaceae bacterium]
MATHSLQPRTTTLIIMILAAAGFRLIQSSNVFSILSNVTPVGAIALFGGCYFKENWKAFLVPLTALALSDLVLNLVFYFDYWTFYFSGVIWIYGSFALMVVMGRYIKRVTALRVVLSGIAAALVHYIITDFGVWVEGILYPRTMSGLMQCYYAAIPYLRNMLVGNLVFCAVLFGAFEWMQRKYPALRIQPS